MRLRALGILTVFGVLLSGCLLGPAMPRNATWPAFEQKTGVDTGVVMRALFSFGGSAGNALIEKIEANQVDLNYDPTFSGPGFIKVDTDRLTMVFGKLPEGISQSNNWIYAVGVMTELYALSTGSDMPVEAGFNIMSSIVTDPGYNTIKLPNSIELGIKALGGGPTSFKAFMDASFTVTKTAIQNK